MPQHTVHCALLYVVMVRQVHLPYAAAHAAVMWLAGLVTCVVLEVPRRMDFTLLHSSRNRWSSQRHVRLVQQTG